MFVMYGLPRNGTNAVEQLIRRNFDIDIQPTGGGFYAVYRKHGLYKLIDCEHTHMIIPIRNIFAWLPSWFRIRHIHPDLASVTSTNFSQFIRDDLINYTVDVPIIDRMNPIQMWNTKIRQWLDVDNGGKTKTIIKHEDMLKDPITIVDKFQLQFPSLKRITHGKVDIVREESGPLGLMRIKHGVFTRKDMLLNREYMNEYTQEDIEFINSHIDWSLIDRLDYREWHENTI